MLSVSLTLPAALGVDQLPQGAIVVAPAVTNLGVQQFYADAWGTYQRHLEQEQHVVGKSNTQKIERKHLTLRTRIKHLSRKTICFSKSVWLHDVVIKLFINRYEFGQEI